MPSRRSRTRAQSLVEFALVTPLLLLVFAGAADMGRAFHAYLAIENAAKEGALFGSRVPLCDDTGGGTCADPNNVTWRVRNELGDQGIRNPDGSVLTPTIACLNGGGTARPNLADCIEGDTYQVGLTYPFRPLTPMLTAIVGNINLTSVSRAVVLNLAFDPTPGASIQKYVSPTGAVNAADVIAKCLEPDENDASGFYFSPCLDSSTPDPLDKLTLRFEQGQQIQYRLYVGNSGVTSLSGITVVDSRGSHGCTIPGTFAVGYSQVCDYIRVAPNVTGPGTTMDYDNTATIDSAQTSPAVASARVTIEKPPARLQVAKRISPYQLGDDGDGVASFGSVDDLTVTYRNAPQVSGGTVWYLLTVRNTGGQDATGLVVSDTNGGLPVNGNCPAVPTTLAPNASWTCRYSITYTSASPAVRNNTVTATATNVVVDGDDDDTATLQVQACSSATNRTVPNLIGLTKAQVATAWSQAGFTGAITDWNGQNSATTVTQNRQALSCLAANSTITITRTTTP